MGNKLTAKEIVFLGPTEIQTEGHELEYRFYTNKAGYVAGVEASGWGGNPRNEDLNDLTTTIATALRDMDIGEVELSHDANSLREAVLWHLERQTCLDSMKGLEYALEEYGYDQDLLEEEEAEDGEGNALNLSYEDLLVQVEKEVEEKFYIFTLSLYQHGGVKLYIGSPTCRWDSGVAGIIYALKEEFDEEYGHTDLPEEERLRKAEEIFTAQVEEYSDYLNGDCWVASVYFVDEEGEYALVEDSQTGTFYGTGGELPEWAQRELAEAIIEDSESREGAPQDLQDVIKRLSAQQTQGE